MLAQLGNRVQHALRAFTPDDAKALKATVGTFPTSEAYDLEELLTSLGIGEAVVTVLSERGAPTPVAWTRLRPPPSLMAPARPGGSSTAIVQASPLLDRVRHGGRPRVRVREAARQGRRRAERGRAGARGAGASTRGPSAREAARGAGAAAEGAGQQRVPQLRPLRGQRRGPRDHPVAVRHGASTAAPETYALVTAA